MNIVSYGSHYQVISEALLCCGLLSCCSLDVSFTPVVGGLKTGYVSELSLCLSIIVHQFVFTLANSALFCMGFLFFPCFLSQSFG